MLSTMPCASRQAKKASRAVQHALRAVRLGAWKAPSAEGRGEVGDGEEEEEGEEEKRGIMDGGGKGDRRGGGRW